MEVLFFTPHVALWVHTVPEAYLARALGGMGYSIRYLTCGRALSYCVCMTAHQISPSEQKADEMNTICKSCVAGAKTIEDTYRFPVAALATYLSEADKHHCRGLAQNALKVRSLDTELHGVAVGRLSLYEFTLAHKKMSTNLSDGQWNEYALFLENALVALTAFARYLDTYSPDVVVSFSPQYSVNNVCMQYAISQGVRVLFIESGTNLGHRLGTLRVWDWGEHGLVNPALKYWEGSERHRVGTESVQLVCHHFEQLLKGKSFAVYSSEYTGVGSIRQRFGIEPAQKVILLTLSSYDEAYAAYLINAFPHNKAFSDVFENQAEWIHGTISWVSSRPDCFLVIRVHPRDFPNKREAVPSEQSEYLKKVLVSTPSNVHVNWPSEGISLYELLDEVDLVASGWSITAMEALILGIPVVTYDARLPSYPSDIIFTGRSREEYFHNLESALQAGWSFQNVKNGFRWLAFNFVQSTVKLSDSFGGHELASSTIIEKIKSRVRLHLPAVGMRMDLQGWRGAREGVLDVDKMIQHGYDSIPAVRKHENATPISEREEHKAMINGLQSLYCLLYGKGQPNVGKSGLSRKIRNCLDGVSIDAS